MINRIKAWYSNQIPLENTQEFSRFLARGTALVEYVASKKVPIRIEKLMNSSYNLESGISLPEWLFNPESYGDVDDRNVIITGMFNGELIKRAVQSASVTTAPDAAMLRSRPDGFTPNDHEQALACYQIIEDLHAQEYAKSTPLGLFSHFVDSVLIQPDLLDPTNLYKVCQAYINHDLRDEAVSLLPPPAVDVLEQVKDSINQRRRAELAWELYSILKTESESQDVGSQATNYFVDAFSPSEEYYEEHNNSDTDLTEQTVEDIMEQILSADGPDGEAVEQRLTVRDAAYNLKYDENFATLGRILAQLRVVNPEPVIPERFGATLLEDELWHAPFDRRIMGSEEERKTKIDTEVIMLVDISGSVQGRLLRRMLEATWGSLISLRRARIPAQVYAFTDDRGKPTLWKIADTKSPDMEARLNSTMTLRNNGTPTGEAMEFLLSHNKFSKRHNHKLLFVLTDGDPNDKDVTTLAINKARRRGISVISLSVDTNVMAYNDRLFGKQWNINASVDISAAMRELILKIGTGEI